MPDPLTLFLLGAALPLGAAAGCVLVWAFFTAGLIAYNFGARYHQAGWYVEEIPPGPAYRRRRLAWAWNYLRDNSAWTMLAPGP